ncbi:MAG TPA: hypothetical protein VE219_05325, partial [Candidatus Sulfotelmatobacter sp.]|nr:hypothetical protein [Candidatus Sulfotelmatobacter sp.]
VRGWLRRRYGVFLGLRFVVQRHAFKERTTVDAYLRHFGATRLVHGHTPHWNDGPHISHDGLVLSFDGRFSRFWRRNPDELFGPIGATVALLPPM